MLAWLIHVWHDSLIHASWLIDVWRDLLLSMQYSMRTAYRLDRVLHQQECVGMTHSWVAWRGGVTPTHSCRCSTSWVLPRHSWRDSFVCGTTDSCVYGLFMCDAPYLNACSMTYSCVTWLIHVQHDSCSCGITHSWRCSTGTLAWLVYAWHEEFMCGMTHSRVESRGDESCHT